MLLLADRGVFSYAPWRKATQTGADLLWQIRTDRSVYQPHHLEDLADGSWLATLRWRRTCSPAAAPSARSRFSSSPSPLDSLRIATAEGLIMVGLTLEADQTDAQRRIDLAVQDFPSALFTRSRHRHPSAALPQLIIRPRPWVLGKTHFRPTRQPKTRAGGIQVVRSPKFSRRSAPQPRRRHQDGGR